MKYLEIVILLVLTGTQILGKQILNDEDSEIITRASRGLTAQLQQFLDVGLREIMKNGNATLGIPVLDPLEQPEVDLDFDLGIVRINGKITELYSEDISTYKVKEAKVSIISKKGTVGLTFPRIYVKGKYSVEGAVMDDISVFGDGEFEATVENFDVDAVIAVSVLGGIKVKSIDLKIALGGLNFTASGIFNDQNTSELLSKVVSDMAPEIISNYHDQITETCSKFLVEIVNKYLEKNPNMYMSDTLV